MRTEVFRETAREYAYRDMPQAELITLAKGGSDRAYGELMARTRGICLRIAAGLLGDRDEAADEVQNAFWKAYVNIGTFKAESKFSTWIVRIVINCCMSRLRSERLTTVPFDSVVEEAYSQAFAPRRMARMKSPEQNVAGKEMQALVRRELRRLPVKLRQPLQYHFLDDLSLDETASRLGISLAAAKSRLSRGQKYLKDRMTMHCGCRGPATLLDDGE
jgi:RNA polymerase sigma-70 factor (ECF subfamily)